MSLWRVTYKEHITMDTDTFSSFDDAWVYTRIFPEYITYIPYNSWFYIAKKEAQQVLAESNRLRVSWSPFHQAEVIISKC
jgi:hypothetical protein